MNNIALRAIILLLAGFGTYKMFPQVQGPVDYYIKNPSFQNGVVKPAIENANQLLPSKLQIPTPEVLGTDASGAVESPLKSLTDEISTQVASVAAKQVENIKDSAQDQVCKALLEKLKSECGQ